MWHLAAGIRAIPTPRSWPPWAWTIRLSAALAAAIAVLSAAALDFGQATHYYRAGTPCRWAVGHAPWAQVGHHSF